MRSDGSLLIEQFFLKFIILFFLFIALARLSLTLSEILNFLQVFRNIYILIRVLKFLKLAQQSFIGCILRFFSHPRNFQPPKSAIGNCSLAQEVNVSPTIAEF